MKYLFWSIFFILDSFVWSQITEKPFNSTCVIDRCFYQEEDACPPPNSECSCRILPDCPRAAVCCNVNQFQLSQGLGCADIIRNASVDALHVRNASLDRFNLSLASWRRIKYLTITNGHIASVEGTFGKYSMVSCLNLSSNGIVKFGNRSLVHLRTLNYLDLSNNNLTEVPHLQRDGNVTLDISDNKFMNCSSVFDALERTKLNFTNNNKTTCSSQKDFHWFNSTEYVPLSQVIGIHELRSNCTKNCTCEPHRFIIVAGKAPTFAVAVNCSGQGLTSLPSPLPPNTYLLNISNNNVSSLDLINSDPTYQHLSLLYADNNQINSIIPLEGSNFMSNFVILSLKNNKIKSIPTYVLSNIFDRNYNTRQLSLGQNRLSCDCNTARVFKVWLLTKQKQIIDYDEIYCDNMDVRVRDLNPSKLCQSKQDWTDYIYYIITLEVVLLVVLITKVSYDYWVFKTAGYLPWPASKMPKLPCDWLCE